VNEVIGRAHNLCTGDAVFLTDSGWVTLDGVGADTAGHVVLAHRRYGSPSAPVLHTVLPWDAPVVAVLTQ